MNKHNERELKDIEDLNKIEAAVQAIIELKSGKYGITEIFDLLEVIEIALSDSLVTYGLLRTDQEELEKFRQRGHHHEASIAWGVLNCHNFPVEWLKSKPKIITKAIAMGATTWQALGITEDKFNQKLQELGISI